jgi:Family of unknown function (DUF5343)
MTTDEVRRSYPVIPTKVWWDLRKRFQRSMPAQVDAGYLQSVLAVQEGHARNLVPQLRAVGLIDVEGKPTPRANAWRTDDDYGDVSRQIVEDVYPQALRDAVPPEEPDRQAAARWFMRELGVGENAAGRMAAFYVLLCQADPSEADRAASQREPTRRRRRAAERPPVSSNATVSTPPPAEPPAPASDPVPSLHIDVQVHIPSDASPEQIDAIFSSMAKHLYKRS